MKRVHGVVRNIRTLCRLGLLGTFLLYLTAHAQAALLGVGGNSTNWPGIPNLASQSLTISYDAGSGQFTALGTTSDYWDLDTNDNYVLDSYDVFLPGTFSLTAFVDHNGVMSSGTVTIACASGIYDSNLDPTPLYGPGTVLQGNLTAFGFEAGNLTLGTSRFDVEFTVTGGSVASVFGPVAGTALYADDYSFGGSFATSFTNGGTGNADTLMMVPEPEPQLLVILSLSLLGLCRVARRRAALRNS